MRHRHCGEHPQIRDYGCEPFIFNIHHAAVMNANFRTVLWTGHHLQLTLMNIPVCGDIGVEMHPDVDQFIRIESGRAEVYMGSCPNHLQKKGFVAPDDAILIPAGTWHNIINAGNRPLKLYSLYAPPQHPAGAVHETQADAERRGY